MTPNIPSTFAEFRRTLAAALKQAGAPGDLIDEIGYIDYEGGGVVQAVFNAWDSVEYELERERKAGNVHDLEMTWEDLVGSVVHDAVIDMVDEYSNPMNYGPGERHEKVDGATLAEKVVNILTGISQTGDRPPPPPVPPKAIRSDLRSFAKDLAASITSNTAAQVTSVSGNLKAEHYPDQTVNLRADDLKEVLDFVENEFQRGGWGFTWNHDERGGEDFYEAKVDDWVFSVDMTYLRDDIARSKKKSFLIIGVMHSSDLE